MRTYKSLVSQNTMSQILLEAKILKNIVLSAQVILGEILILNISMQQPQGDMSLISGSETKRSGAEKLGGDMVVN